MRAEVDVYRVTIGAGLPTVVNSGRQVVVPFTSCTSGLVFLSVRLEVNELNIRAEAKVSATQTSATLTVPSDLVGGTYTIRVVTLNHASLVGDNTNGNFLRVQATKTINVKSPFRFDVGDYSQCNAACGKGVRTRTVRCMDDSLASPAQVANTFCTNAGLTQPASEEDCFQGACSAPTWFYSPFGACSKQCGYGTQNRSEACIGVDGIATVAASQCLAVTTNVRPPLTRACNSFACPTYTWSVFPFGPCSITCGTGGTKTRYVACQEDGSGKYVADSKCTAPKPATVQSCDAASSCEQPFFTYGVWSSCSKQCGTGESTRTHQCHTSLAGGVDATGAACTNAGLTPVVSRVCNTARCVRVERELLDATCSAECGGGVQRVARKCVDKNSNAVVDNQECIDAGLDLGAATVACNQQPCVKDNFCQDQDCNFAGTCSLASGLTTVVNGETLDGACECNDDYKGDYCQNFKQCNDGDVIDLDGNCCSGILDSTFACCESKAFDKSGTCCPAATPYRNACGLCTADENDARRLDADGACCLQTERAGGLCCSGTIDSCGVCNGVNACPRAMATTWVTGTSALDLLLSGAVTSYNSDLRAAMNLDAAHGLDTVLSDGNRRLLTSATTFVRSPRCLCVVPRCEHS